MYLISIYFDEKTNKILQRYIDRIAEKSGNYFMIENKVPPHMTIASIEARNVNVLKPAFEDLNGKLCAGNMKVVSIGQLFPYVLYATPVMNQKLFDQAAETEAQFGEIMETYERSFQLFAHMMAREIEHEPDPDSVRTYLKGMDASLLNIVGETYDGLYMYYKGQYLYSWDTPYSVYEDSGMW